MITFIFYFYFFYMFEKQILNKITYLHRYTINLIIHCLGRTAINYYPQPVL